MSSVAFPNLQWGRIVAIGEKKIGEQGGDVPGIVLSKKKGGAGVNWPEARDEEKKRRGEGRK